MNSAFCHRCQHETATTFLKLSTGHIGNLCAECRTARRGRPYVSREFAAANTPDGVEGRINELQGHGRCIR
ncbi:MAG: hypothetical protein WCS52_07230 [bacterium]